MTKPLDRTNRDMLLDIVGAMHSIPGCLESLLAQSREHAQERATWQREREGLELQRDLLVQINDRLVESNGAQSATLQILISLCESQERDNDKLRTSIADMTRERVQLKNMEWLTEMRGPFISRGLDPSAKGPRGPM